MTEEIIVTEQKNYDDNFVSGIYDHNKEKDKHLKRRKATAHTKKKRYKKAELSKNTRYYGGYWLKDERLKKTFEFREYPIPKYVVPIKERVWEIRRVTREDKDGIPRERNELNFRDYTVGYKVYSGTKRKKVCIFREYVPIEPILKRGTKHTYFSKVFHNECIRNIPVTADIGTAPANYKKVKPFYRWLD